VEKFCEVTTFCLKVIDAHMLNFKPILGCLLLNIVVWTLVPGGVCVSKFSSACANIGVPDRGAGEQSPPWIWETSKIRADEIGNSGIQGLNFSR